MAKRQLFKIESTSVITGRGIVLFPGIVPIGDERFKIGDLILLRMPDGREVTASIGGLEFPFPNPRREVLVLLMQFRKSDVPIGTEVWSL